MGLAVKVYEAFKDDEKKAKVLSEVVDELESRFSPLRDVATKGDVELAKLALQKEIEQVRLSLQKEIEQVRASVIKWVTGLLLVQTGVIISVITLIK